MKPFPLLLLLLGAFTVRAQHPVSGRIIDCREAPVAWATVVLTDLQNRQLGSVSDGEGLFRIEAPAGRYTLTVRCLGYEPEEYTVSVAEALDLGDLCLKEATTAIGEVVVKAQAIRRSGDRYVMTVGDTPAAAGKNGAELLADAPGVWVDDRGIRINGTTGAKLFVDDREIRLSGEEQAAYLQQLTAAEIASVEVTPQAGAEYTADTPGGVIRIRLRRQQERGATGSLAFTTRQSDRIAGYDPAAAVAAQTGRWSWNLSAGGGFLTREEQRYEESRLYLRPADPYSAISEACRRRNRGRVLAGAVWEIDSRNTLGVEAEYTRTGTRIPTRALTHAGSLTAASDYLQRPDGQSLSAALNYSRQFDTLGSRLKLLVDYTADRSASGSSYRTRFLSAAGSADTLYFSRSTARRRIAAADLSFEKHFNARTVLTTGLRYSHNASRDRSAYEAGVSETVRRPLPDYGRALDYTEKIASAFASLSTRIGRWSLSAGIRGEYTRLSGPAADYFGLFPNGSVTYAFNDMQTWMITVQYGRNIQRPAFASLDPARVQLSEYSYQTGNPALRPTYIHRISATAIWKYRYTLTLGANLHRDLVREVCRTDPANPEATCIVPENHHREEHWFAALSAPLQPARRWRIGVDLVGVWQRIELERGAGIASHPLAFVRCTSDIELPKGFRIEIACDHHSRLYSGNSEIAGRCTLSLYLRKLFFDDRLTLRIGCDNLTDARESYASTLDGFRRLIAGYRGVSARCWTATLSWRFRRGAEVRERRIERGAAEERSRLQRGETTEPASGKRRN